MIEHLYSPLMSDVIVRLLNFNQSVLRKDSDDYPDLESMDKNSNNGKDEVNEISDTHAQEVRIATVFSIIERFGIGYTFDQQLSALDCLTELADDPNILSIMLRPSSLDLIKTLLQQASQQDEEASKQVKTICYRYLIAVLNKTFKETAKGEENTMHADGWKLSRTGKFIADFGSDANAENEKLRTEL